MVKVELAGDDQVMNRMLCVWIDDSADQDAAVLAHLKSAEAKEANAEKILTSLSAGRSGSS